MNTWRFITEEKKSGHKVTLLYVVSSSGSSPGRQGFKMAVSSSGKMCGSIGGGIMEHKFVEMAKDEIKSGAEKISLHQQLHQKDAGFNKSGMICSGQQTLLIYPFKNEDIAAVEHLLKAESLFKTGTLRITNAGLYYNDNVPSENFYFQQSGEEFTYIEKTGFKYQLHIIGGGHCSLALSKLFAGQDFLITVYDDRENLNTLEQNVFAHKIVLINNYDEISGFIKDVNGNFVVVMTFGYRTDDKVIRSFANRQFDYFGVLGSAAKIHQLKMDYQKEKFSAPVLENMYAPAGIAIHSQTPMEIAISIAAQIISVKNGRQQI